MPTTIPVAAFIVGAVFILIALLGGNFEIFTIKISGSIPRSTRIIAGLVGAFFIVLGLGLSISPSQQPPPTQPPASAPTTAPAHVLQTVVEQQTVVTQQQVVVTATPPPKADVAGAAACAPSCQYKDMTLCFPQLGAESDWRTVDTASFKDTAQKLGIKQLVFSNAQMKQENQISAMRACIQEKVNVIALPPIVEDGWEPVLTEAKAANIPVIIVDRNVSASQDLWASHIGSDMELEGKRAAAEFNKLMPNGGAILELSGTTGSLAQVGRSIGIREALNSNIKILDSQTGNFIHAEAKPVMEAFLKEYKAGIDFQGVFIQNDDMGLGVIEVLKAAGVKPGDLKIVSVDGTRGGFQAMVDGWFQADVECNPLLGPQVFDVALKLMNGQPVDREIPTNETVYYPDNAAQLLPTRQY